ncbi:hypothetical protein GCM10022222_80000 [Amycolatopsis ultiminotia]|uniref:Excreted virulence factor EspC, type VII ESX diderm n=1 Tax=Amycolatopsis ultiminotia TaxID=543629 RepID=A0ABP6YJP5_9PSEU
MAQELSGVTDSMQKFSPQAPSGVLGGAGNAATASGGMAEGAAFAQAEEESAQALQKFMTDVQKGFGEYASIARKSAEDYLGADRSGKSTISRVQDLSPLKPGVPR